MDKCKKPILLLIISTASLGIYAQQPELQYFRPNDKRGINVFETSKDSVASWDGKIKVRVGADFAVQYQALSQSNQSIADTLVELGDNFSLPTANLNFDVQLERGVRLHLRTYLSSRHHPEAWVKGGHIQIDRLDFIKKGFLDGIMQYTTLRFGMDEINYGDAHFRRSDNSRALYNPFVGNYIMDAFTTEPFAEITFQKSGFIAVAGISNGRLNQQPIADDDGRVYFGKLAYDNQLDDDTRVRLSGSIYSSTDQGTRDYLYGGDRAGAHYYNIGETIDEVGARDFQPRFNPNFQYQTSFQINPFVKYKGLEFFGVLEMASNGNDEVGGDFSQFGGELVYRFGSWENLYVGARYNYVEGEISDDAETLDIDRLNFAFGWFLTKNIMTKIEYVTSTYSEEGFTADSSQNPFAPNATRLRGLEWDGLVIQAAISF